MRDEMGVPMRQRTKEFKEQLVSLSESVVEMRQRTRLHPTSPVCRINRATHLRLFMRLCSRNSS